MKSASTQGCVSVYTEQKPRKVTGPLDYTPYWMTAAQAEEATEFCRKQREALAKLTERSRPPSA